MSTDEVARLTELVKLLTMRVDTLDRLNADAYIGIVALTGLCRTLAGEIAFDDDPTRFKRRLAAIESAATQHLDAAKAPTVDERTRLLASQFITNVLATIRPG